VKRYGVWDSNPPLGGDVPRKPPFFKIRSRALYGYLILFARANNVRLTLETRKLQFITSLTQNIFNEEGFRWVGELARESLFGVSIIWGMLGG
jgi:hypothetical protein